MVTCLDPQDQDNSFNMDSKCNNLENVQILHKLWLLKLSFYRFNSMWSHFVLLSEASNGERKREVLQIREKKQKKSNELMYKHLQAPAHNNSTTMLFLPYFHFDWGSLILSEREARS